MPPVKNWQGPPSMTPSSDPKAKPTEGSARPMTQDRWQGPYGATPKPDPREKPAGSAKLPGSR